MKVYVSEKIGFVDVGKQPTRPLFRICIICRGSMKCQACYTTTRVGCICNRTGLCVICGGTGLTVIKD